jgi:hypothetical protein
VDPSYEVPKSQDKNAWYSVSELENALRVAGWKDVNRDVVRAKFEQGTNTPAGFVDFGLKEKILLRCG